MSDLTLKAGVIIPAGGSGIRMGGERKQFRMLGGRPLLIQTALAFLAHEYVGAVVAVVPGDSVSRARDLFDALEIRKKTYVAKGGPTRQESVWNGLNALPEGLDVVLVHDAVRPFVTRDLIKAVTRAADRYGSAAAAVPVTDTLRRGSAGCFDETVDRDHTYRMQTPQGFRREILRDAHERARAAGVEATDEVALVQRCGHSVRIVEGDELNVKITTTADWMRCAALWPWWVENQPVSPQRER